MQMGTIRGASLHDPGIAERQPRLRPAIGFNAALLLAAAISIILWVGIAMLVRHLLF